MITRYFLSLVSALTLVGATACAQEANNQDTQNTATAVAQKVVADGKTQALGFVTSDEDWRDVDPENTLYLTTKYGVSVIELAPEFAPKHIEQIKTLVRQHFYDDITFHRVIKDFMNQTGDPKGDGTGGSELPDIEGEFVFRRDPSLHVTLTGKQLFNSGEVSTGFYKAFPVATQPIAQSILTKDGKVEAWGLHCPNTTSMARSGDPNSANSQFFLMRGEAPRLDRSYTVWGTTVWGRDVLTKIKVGTVGEDENFVPDTIESLRLMSEIPEEDRLPVQVLRTDSPAFTRYLDAIKTKAGVNPDVCDIVVPTRLKP